jgi:hypothetical protein
MQKAAVARLSGRVLKSRTKYDCLRREAFGRYTKLTALRVIVYPVTYLQGNERVIHYMRDMLETSYLFSRVLCEAQLTRVSGEYHFQIL